MVGLLTKVLVTHQHRLDLNCERLLVLLLSLPSKARGKFRIFIMVCVKMAWHHVSVLLTRFLIFLRYLSSKFCSEFSENPPPIFFTLSLGRNRCFSPAQKIPVYLVVIIIIIIRSLIFIIKKARDWELLEAALYKPMRFAACDFKQSISRDVLDSVCKKVLPRQRSSYINASTTIRIIANSELTVLYTELMEICI